ncbi:tRNA uracil 4-sulfurtransferase ThiI [Marinibactrum halimedae]|uniref:tRNA sulfurtransferase n=1 Tax=Marinibactrum halimedae TaxID=1444977 RepID=A0AA37T6S9_9GAMM|nr:tRNA uracil 4-sulfurtransferase ThiI [Marinibactrum halimedae]MCD9459306.1 tRNA 4-thiouridine(8) synthase ThiI [Marinibactrum halimedae]GLS25802.1 tRNA sulfurtransferase [Marinibactrum halimedae]
MHFIVKLFPEIIIKSPPVRKRFIKILKDNLRLLLRPIEESIVVKKDFEKIDVFVEWPEALSDAQIAAKTSQVIDVLSNTPGIAFFSEVEQTTFSDMHDIYEKTHAQWASALENKTFCVRVKRHGDHPFSSVELERYVGGGLNQNSNAAGVKLKNPDVEVRMEVKHDRLYIVKVQRPGIGGYPLGSQDPVLSLISGGFDSTVSSYLTMKRGVRTHFCFFNLGGRAHEIGVKEVAYYLWSKYASSHLVKFVTVPFEPVVGEILHKIPNSQMGVVLKRMMMRAASKVAEEMHFQAVVTGESVAQVSSQTIPNLAVIDKVCDVLTMRPLITTDKGDIIALSRTIGTEVFAANMPEYCGVISKRPTTRAKLEVIEAVEEHFDFATLDAAVANRKVESIDKVMEGIGEAVGVDEFSYVPTGAQVIDVRHPDEQEAEPLRLDECLHIPFYRLHTEWPSLPSDQQYLLYCKKGVMSKLHASQIVEEGNHNVGVYRPKTD